MGSEGADQVVETNTFYSDGKSQIFKIANCGHCANYHNPERLGDILIGFFNETITGKYELKPQASFVPGEATTHSLP